MWRAPARPLEALGLETRDDCGLFEVRIEGSVALRAGRHANATEGKSVRRRYRIELEEIARLRAPELLGRRVHRLGNALTRRPWPLHRAVPVGLSQSGSPGGWKHGRHLLLHGALSQGTFQCTHS